MVKLCRACGYINRDDALECEECHSIFDDKLSSLINNNIEKNTNSNNDQNDYQHSEILSISDIIKQNNEDVILDQKEFDSNVISSVNTNTVFNEELNIDDYNIDDYNKEDNRPQYVSDFLYQKNGESDNFTLDENTFIGDPNQIDESSEELETNNNYSQNSSNDVSDFLYNSTQNINNSIEPTYSIDIDSDFESASVSDLLYRNVNETNIISNDPSTNNELDEDFDAEENVTNILYDNYDNDNNIVEDNEFDSLGNNLIDSNEIRPFDIIYNDSQSKDVNDFLYDDSTENIAANSSISNENAENENNILEEISPTIENEYNEVFEPADVDESYIVNEENIPVDDGQTIQSSNLNDNTEENTLTEVETVHDDEIDQPITIDINNNFDVLSNDNSYTSTLDALTNDVLEDDSTINSTNNNDDIVTLNEEEITDIVNKELSDATYMQNLDINNILGYGDNEEIDQNNESEDNIETDYTQTSTKTGLLDTLKQIFSFSNSKELSKEELDNEYRNDIDNSNTENIDEDNVAPLENLNINHSNVQTVQKTSNFANVKPMEIRRKNVENINKAISSKDDDELANAFEVFENVGTHNIKSEESPETVVYDIPSGNINKQDKVEQGAIPEKKKSNSKKTKLLVDDKQLLKKPLSRKQIFIRRSIALSVAVAAIVITIIVISRINKEKELNAYAARLAANNDVSYTYLYNSLLEKGYSEDESFKAIESLNIDFADNALNIIYSIAQDSNKLSTKEQVKNILVSKGFANSEIEKAMSIVDWTKYLNVYIDACISKTKELDKNSIIKSIQDAGFTTTEIEYIKKNSDWTKLVKKNLDSFLNNEEEILHTKEEAKKHLEERGYSNQDIENAFKNYEWDVYAYQYLTKYLQQKEDEGTIIESSRISYTKILEDAKFDEEEIELVMGRFDFASYAASKIDTIANDGKFVDKKQVRESLEKEGYTENEIENALKATDWNATAISSLESLKDKTLSKADMLKRLKDAGYSETEIEYANKNYKWGDQLKKYVNDYLVPNNKNGSEEHLRSLLKECGYTEDEIRDFFYNLSANYFVEAAKEATKDIEADTNFSRRKIRNYLSNLNYNNADIDAVIKYYTNKDIWVNKATSLINSININSRAEARKNLQEEDFNADEINKAINDIPPSSWSNMCIDYAKSIYNQNSDEMKCQDYKTKMKDHQETSIEQTLRNAEYSSEEIDRAMTNLFIPEPCSLN